jgi:uncharacterized RDD family membrane protein YckC
LPPRADRVGELLEGVKRPARTITSPEGVALGVRLASRGERMAAFSLDMAFMLIGVICAFVITAALYALLLGDNNNGHRTRVTFYIVWTLFNFAFFVIRVMYFTHFELAWQGRTPGKRICGIRVIDRDGGPLTPRAIIARNLTREVEIFIPLALLFALQVQGTWSALLTLGWALALTALPFFNRDRLRAGDMIAGTLVILMPKRRLMEDLSGEGQDPGGYSFTTDQLAIYGAFELQVLEELLRRPQSAENDKLLSSIASKIRRKIGLNDEIPPQNIRRFLSDFYSAERGSLERGQLFGHYKDDKNS